MCMLKKYNILMMIFIYFQITYIHTVEYKTNIIAQDEQHSYEKNVHIINIFIVIWEVDPNDSREGYKGSRLYK